MGIFNPRAVLSGGVGTQAMCVYIKAELTQDKGTEWSNKSSLFIAVATQQDRGCQNQRILLKVNFF